MKGDFIKVGTVYRARRPVSKFPGVFPTRTVVRCDGYYVDYIANPLPGEFRLESPVVRCSYPRFLQWMGGVVNAKN
jgi:hypothetical protein